MWKVVTDSSIDGEIEEVRLTKPMDKFYGFMKCIGIEKVVDFIFAKVIELKNKSVYADVTRVNVKILRIISDGGINKISEMEDTQESQGKNIYNKTCQISPKITNNVKIVKRSQILRNYKTRKKCYIRTQRK